MSKVLQKALTIADLKSMAQKRVPRMFFDYADSGSWTQSTYDANESDYSGIKFRQRVCVDMRDRTLESSMIGRKVAMPIANAPTGFAGMQEPDGEIKAARACAKFGIPYAMSTLSICSIEDVAENTNEPFWFQLYMLKDRPFMENLINRAITAKCSALILTLDLQILGQRHKDIHNHLTAPPKFNVNTAMQFITRPSWCIRMLGTKRWSFRNIVGHAKGVSDLSSLASWTAEQFDPALDWDTVAWVRERWPGKFILKGILDEDDARACTKAGADAIIVSNHGGRQLDAAPSSISMLPRILDAVKGSGVEVHIDGGIRSGQDILRALMLGADGVYAGRPFLYGLGAGGEAGVTRALEILQKEMDITMAL